MYELTYMYESKLTLKYNRLRSVRAILGATANRSRLEEVVERASHIKIIGLQRALCAEVDRSNLDLIC